MSGDIERRILEDIEKTGYPLEVDIINRLLESDWIVFPQYLYTDEHTGKLRTVDVFASYPLAEPKITANLIVECKTSTEKPWVFFVANTTAKDLSQMTRTQIMTPTLMLMGGTVLNLLRMPPAELRKEEKTTQIPDELQTQIKDIYELHFFDKNLPRAHSCYVPFKGGDADAPDDFQKALNQIRGVCLELATTPNKSPIFATVVFRGNLFIFEGKEDRKNLQGVNHVLFHTQYLLPQEIEEELIQSFPPVIIDVVKDTYFKEYLAMLNGEMNTLGKLCAILEKSTKS